MANALLVIITTFLALHLVRGYPCDLLLFAVAALPSTLSISATLSADPAVISCSLLLLAVSMRLVARNFSVGLWFTLWLALAYVGIAKVAYLPLALVPTACACGRGGTNRSRAAALSAGVAVFIVTVVWVTVTRPYVFPITTSPGVDVGGQMLFLRLHPIDGIRALLTSMILEVPHSQLTLVGWKLAGGDVILPLPLATAATLALVIGIALSGSDETPLSVRMAGSFLMLASATFTFLLLYIQNTKVGGTRVEGYQGRYLLPVLPFVALVLPKWRPSHLRSTDALRTVVILCSCTSAVGVTLFVAARQWQ